MTQLGDNWMPTKIYHLEDDGRIELRDLTDVTKGTNSVFGTYEE